MTLPTGAAPLASARTTIPRQSQTATMRRPAGTAAAAREDLLLVVLMFAGRIGPLTLASALALRERTRRFELPEERTIVG